ncbi:hypothetical protein, partial [Sporomusa sp.]|uniref:hypothetical protein n=1 Tax=Sporomusa sp. TaxID=2078658 RepID=UPI002C00C8A8
MRRPDSEEDIGQEAERTLARITKEGYLKLPMSLTAEQAALIVKTADGYRISLLVPDVKKVYLEVTTKCNFSCITCIR